MTTTNIQNSNNASTNESITKKKDKNGSTNKDIEKYCFFFSKTVISHYIRKKEKGLRKNHMVCKQISKKNFFLAVF